MSVLRLILAVSGNVTVVFTAFLLVKRRLASHWRDVVNQWHPDALGQRGHVIKSRRRSRVRGALALGIRLDQFYNPRSIQAKSRY